MTLDGDSGLDVAEYPAFEAGVLALRSATP